MSTFVSVGNATQPFFRLLNGINGLISRNLLPYPILIQHGHTPFKPISGVTAIPFLSMEKFENQIDSATLLILHGGAGSIIHACHAGKIPVVMPRNEKYGEHIDNHQLEFIEALAGQERVVMVENEEGLYTKVQLALRLQQRTIEGRSKMEVRMVQLIEDVLKKSGKEIRP